MLALFESLTFLLHQATQFTISLVSNLDVFECLIIMAQLDKQEMELFDKSETSNDFYY